MINGQIEFTEAVLSSTNRKGKRFDCKVLVSRMNDADGAPGGAILLMEPTEA